MEAFLLEKSDKMYFIFLQEIWFPCCRVLLRNSIYDFMDTHEVLSWKFYLIPRKATFHYSCTSVISVKQADWFKEHFHTNLHAN